MPKAPMYDIGAMPEKLRNKYPGLRIDVSRHKGGVVVYDCPPSTVRFTLTPSEIQVPGRLPRVIVKLDYNHTDEELAQWLKLGLFAARGIIIPS